MASICFAHNLIAFWGNSLDVTIQKFDNKIPIQTLNFKDKPQDCQFVVHHNEVYIAVLDAKGEVYVHNISQNKLVSQIHTALPKGTSIACFKLLQSEKSSSVYVLDNKKTKIWVYDYLTGILKSSIRLEEKVKREVATGSSQKLIFDVDSKEKNIVYNDMNKIIIMNVNTSSVRVLGEHSSSIAFLAFSGKFVLSIAKSDYYVSIWLKNKKDEDDRLNTSTNPIMALQVTSVPEKALMIKVDKGVYHAFAYNSQFIFGYKLLLGEIDPYGQNKHDIKIEFPDKNLLDIDIATAKSPQIVAVYGSIHQGTGSEVIKYANSSTSFKDLDIKVSSHLTKTQDDNHKTNQLTAHYTVLNDAEMNAATTTASDQVIENNIFKKLLLSNCNLNNPMSDFPSSDIITLITSIKNSLINKDNQTFLWCLEQHDINLIEATVMKMDSDTIKNLILKLIELFQSNSILGKENLIPWMNNLFKYHFFTILSMDKSVISNLNIIHNNIQNMTRNFTKLIAVQTKLENLIRIISVPQNNSQMKAKDFEPLLVYNESEDEEDMKKKKKIKNQMEKRGIKRKKVEMNEEQDMDVDVERNSQGSEVDSEEDLMIDEDLHGDDDMIKDNDQIDEDQDVEEEDEDNF